MAGTKIMKFDTDLKMVAEADIPMDYQKMGRMGRQMMQNCPYWQQMMKDQEMMDSEPMEE